jgi:hypothetical protein
MPERLTIRMPEETRHDRFERRYFSPLLWATFLAVNAAYPVREDLSALSERLPREARSLMRSGEAEDQAERWLLAHREAIERGDPLPIDLFEFYLTQERLAGGVTPEEEAKARQRFEEIIGFAKRLQAEGKSRDEVLGYILKQQGAYDPRSSFMIDLLAEGKGECEARMRYVSASVQELYPDLVAEGKMKTEVFRPWVDESGKLHVGHVRVVIDEGRRVAVLEGDAVRWGPSTAHEGITATETTSQAVKGYAAKQGLYSFEDNAFVEKPQLIEETKQLLTKGLTSENLEKAVGVVLNDQGVSAYPMSIATYEGGNANSDVDERPVMGSWAVSREDWTAPIELTLKYGELKPEDAAAVVKKVKGVVVDIRRYEQSVSAETMRAIRDEIKKADPEATSVGLRVRGDETLPLSELSGYALDLVATSAFAPERFAGAPLSGLRLEGVREVPSGLGALEWGEDPALSIEAAADAPILAADDLREIKDVIFSTVSFTAQPGSDIHLVSGYDAVPKAKSIFLEGVLPSMETRLEAEQVYVSSGTYDWPVGALAGVKAGKLKIVLSGGRTKQTKVQNTWFRSGEMKTQVRWLDIRAFDYADFAFAGMKMETLSLTADHLPPTAFTHTEIGFLVINGMGTLELDSPSKYNSPFLGISGLRRIIFEMATSDARPTETYRHWKKEGYFPSGASVFVMPASARRIFTMPFGPYNGIQNSLLGAHGTEI